MSVERERGMIRFTCDGANCRHNYESEAEEFREAWAEARDLGWDNTEHRGTWKHFCPQCARENDGW